VIRKRTVHRAEELIRIRIPDHAPSTCKASGWEYLLTIPQARKMLADLRFAFGEELNNP
jgi:hypothetical protein